MGTETPVMMPNNVDFSFFLFVSAASTATSVVGEPGQATFQTDIQDLKAE